MAEKRLFGENFQRASSRKTLALRLVLGTCPTLAVTTSLESAVGMGLAASVVLVCSNIVISAMRKIIPQKVRIPAYIVIIAGFVTIVQMLVRAFLPQIDEMLGVYLPLIVVNCIILGRAEAFAGKNPCSFPPSTDSEWASALRARFCLWAEFASFWARVRFTASPFFPRQYRL